MEYTFVHKGNPEGPYTKNECRARVEEIFKGEWHWMRTPGGYHLAIDTNTGDTIAEAIEIN